MRKNNRLFLTSVVIISSLSLTACNVFTRNPYTDNLQVSNTVKGTATIAAIGGSAPLTFGANAAHANTAASVAGGGAVVGAVGGYMMDKEEAALRERLRGTGVRVLENVNDSNNDIVLIMPSDIHFAASSAALSPRFQNVLDSVALVMKEFKYSVAEIGGSSDNVGSKADNQNLSHRRAQAIADYLAAQGISRDRLVTAGYGERCPAATNRTAVGRAMNRSAWINLHQPPITSNEPVLKPGILDKQ